MFIPRIATWWIKFRLSLLFLLFKLRWCPTTSSWLVSKQNSDSDHRPVETFVLQLGSDINSLPPDFIIINHFLTRNWQVTEPQQGVRE